MFLYVMHIVTYSSVVILLVAFDFELRLGLFIIRSLAQFWTGWGGRSGDKWMPVSHVKLGLSTFSLAVAAVANLKF